MLMMNLAIGCHNYFQASTVTGEQLLSKCSINSHKMLIIRSLNFMEILLHEVPLTKSSTVQNSTFKVTID